MRICFFNRSYWPDVAATGQLLSELAEDLVARHGCEVTVVAGRPLTTTHALGVWPVREERHRGVRILRANGTSFGTKRFAGRGANYLSYLSTATAASLLIGRADVVVSLTDPPVVGLLALAAARRRGVPFVFLCEDIFPEVARLLDDFRNEALDRLLDRINRRLLAEAAAVVALGPRMRRRLVEEKGVRAERVTEIHNWADGEAIRPVPKDNPFTRAHGLDGKFVVMHSGNVGASQDLDVVIEAADRLRTRNDIVFLIVGGGSRLEAVRTLASAKQLDNVRFLPYQPKEALDLSFGAADVFIVSLRAGVEGYIVPSKVYGILAAGRPYIAALAEDAEPAVIARETGCGCVVPPGDAEALATALASLASNRARTAAMGALARAASARFDRPVAVAAYYKLFRAIAGAGAHA